MKELVFKKMDGTVIKDVTSYVCDFVRDHEGARVIVGCDSNQICRIAGKWELDKVKDMKSKTISAAYYAVVIAMFYPGHKGAHLISARFRKDKFGAKFTLYERLWEEVESAIKVAEMLEEAIVMSDIYVDREPGKNFVNIHLDANEDPKFASNMILKLSYGYVQQLGYNVEYKPSAWVASYAADLCCKS